MPTVTRARTRSIRRGVLVALATAAVLLASGTGAHAAPQLTTATSHVATVGTASCHLMGQSDEAGVFYSMCGQRIRRYDRNGERMPDVNLPAGLGSPRDVAPSLDGAFLYVSQGANTPRRLNRRADGTYVLDAAWRLKQFSVWNVKWTPIGHALATDGRGDIYVSNGSYWTNADTQNSVAKFRPDGTSITAFGDYGKTPGMWVTNQDIAVSRDGRRVYVGENCGTACVYTDPNYSASRVTRYDYSAGGTYRYTRIISAQGAMDGNRFPRCTSAGATHSAYSLAMDGNDQLYATSTTCGRIQQFHTGPNPADDRFVRSVGTMLESTTGDGVRNHYISADWAGRIYAYEWNRTFTPKVITLPALPRPPIEPLPEPDVQAPVLTSITIPAITTTRTVAAGITATDDRGVTEMQFANEDGVWGPWQPFVSPVNYELSANFGIKRVNVRVRDMAGNTTELVFATTEYRAAAPPPGGGDPPPGGNPPAGGADAADPIIVSATAPGLIATNTLPVTVEATDDVAVTGIRFANEDGNWSAYRPFAATTQWNLTPGQGGKVVYVMVRDAAGRESNRADIRTRVAADAPADQPPAGGGPLDETPPVLVAMEVPAESTTQVIDVKLNATDNVAVSQARFANEDGNWSPWMNFAPTTRWQLSAGFGTKVVYAQVRDARGLESQLDKRTLKYVQTVAGPVDDADPVLTTFTVPATVPTAAITATLAGNDDIGVTQVRFANEDGNWGAWKAFAQQVPHTLTPGNTLKAVFAQVRDAVGRESNLIKVTTRVTG